MPNSGQELFLMKKVSVMLAYTVKKKINWNEKN